MHKIEKQIQNWNIPKVCIYDVHRKGAFEFKSDCD